MKKRLCRLLPPLLLAALPAAALAETTVDSTTILRVQQEAQSPAIGTGNKTLTPITEYLGVDADKLGDGNLSLHMLGWGQLEFADRDAVPGSADRSIDGKLTYGYLQYRLANANAQARAGRVFITEGIVNEQIDGVSARTDLPYGFGVSTFGGATVHTVKIGETNTDGKGDGIFGGRVNYRYRGLLEVGLSGVYESAAPTPLVAPGGTPPLNGSFGNHRLVGGDLFVRPLDLVQISGHTSFNTETEQVAEHSYLLQLTLRKDLVVTGNYDFHHDRDLFYSSPLFSSANLLKSLTQQSKVYGGGATYTINKNLDLSGDFKQYKRDIGEAQRFGGDLRGNYLDNALRAGLSYHYLRASANFAVVPVAGASGSFHEGRVWAMHDTKTYVASVDFIDYVFKEPVEDKRYAWEGQASVGYHLTPEVTVSGDISYGQNPQYRDETKGLVRLTYNAKGGAK